MKIFVTLTFILLTVTLYMVFVSLVNPDIKIGGTCHLEQAKELDNHTTDQACTCYGFEWTQHDTRPTDGELKTVCVGVGVRMYNK